LSAADFGKFLQEQLAIIDHNRLETIPVERYLRLTIPLYGAILQRRHIAIDRLQLLSIIGKPLSSVVEDIVDIQFHDMGFIGAANSSAFQFTNSALEQIEQFFENPLHNFNLLKPIPYFPRITGSRFIEYLNLIEPISAGDLSSLVGDSLRSALPAISIETIDERNPEIKLVMGPKGVWHFILSTIPFNSALTIQMVNETSSRLVVEREKLQVSRKLNDLNILLIAPVTEDRNALASIEELNRIRVYHLWTLQTVRFFNMLANAISGREESAAVNFLSVFPPEVATPISALKAIDRLKKKLH